MLRKSHMRRVFNTLAQFLPLCKGSRREFNLSRYCFHSEGKLCDARYLTVVGLIQTKSHNVQRQSDSLPRGLTGRSSSSLKDTHSDWWEAMTLVREVIFAAGYSSSLGDHKEESECERGTVKISQ